jgi:hypothetical protein
LLRLIPTLSEHSQRTKEDWSPVRVSAPLIATDAHAERRRSLSGSRSDGPAESALRLLDRGDVEGERDRVADDHVAAAQGLVELHPVVSAGELAGDLQP